MRFLLAPGHQTEFNNKGSVFFEGLAAPKRSLDLFYTLDAFVKEKTDVKDDRSYQCLFRSVPAVDEFIYRQSLADFASALLNRRPLWLVYDEYFPYPRPIRYTPGDHHDCVLLLNLKHPTGPGSGVFFKEKLPENEMIQPPESALFLMAFSYASMADHCPMFSCG